ncbi:MAG: BolA family transcriptional regulator [Proteobacteria bacterium]|mgnify:CR=1 FL=1|jgi:BolA family transcriptional regulator, general stress-responsive regulator|nr:BolA family transcriptional regulator [Pseudomonadota bacterium]HCK04678.1 transcriptional regulator [Methylophilaceae bacterium]|tara:strand:- start:18278 stop:18532 length:255 start_codon:yes stop_codon:yes gene_type:complete
MTIDIIRNRLAFLKPISLDIEDESSLHRGHVGNTGGGHFNLVIISEIFENKSTMERHRLVYSALKDLIPKTIHALSIKTLTPPK